MADPDQLLNTSDAARVLGVSVDWVRLLSNQGRIPVMRTSAGHRLFKRSDLEQIAAERKRQPPRRGRPKKKATKVTAKKTTKGRTKTGK